MNKQSTVSEFSKGIMMGAIISLIGLAACCHLLWADGPTPGTSPVASAMIPNANPVKIKEIQLSMKIEKAENETESIVIKCSNTSGESREKTLSLVIMNTPPGGEFSRMSPMAREIEKREVTITLAANETKEFRFSVPTIKSKGSTTANLVDGSKVVLTVGEKFGLSNFTPLDLETLKQRNG